MFLSFVAWSDDDFNNSDEDKSALALAFSHVAEQRKLAIVAESGVDVNNDGVIDEKDAELEMLELGTMERDLMASKIFDEFVTPEEELRRMFDRVQRSMQTRYVQSSVPVWRRTFFDGSESKEHQVMYCLSICTVPQSIFPVAFVLTICSLPFLTNNYNGDTYLGVDPSCSAAAQDQSGWLISATDL